MDARVDRDEPDREMCAQGLGDGEDERSTPSHRSALTELPKGNINHIVTKERLNSSGITASTQQLLGEMDLRHEAQNVRRLAAALREQGTLYVPGIIDPFISAAVLVQEFAPGRPLAERFGTPAGEALAIALLDAYLHQMFVVGAFHADPHPGNLFAREDGRLCLHDFGLIGTLDPFSRQSLGRMLESVIYRDADAALTSAIDLGFIAGTFDRRALQRGIDTILSELQGQPLAEWSIAETLWRIAQLGAREHFRIPRHLLVLLRALFLLESTLRSLNPRFDLVKELLDRRQLLQTVLVAPNVGGAGERPKGQLALRSIRGLPRLLAHWLEQAQADDGRPQISINPPSRARTHRIAPRTSG